MTRHHHRRPDGSDLRVEPAAQKELADLLADLDSFGIGAPAVLEPEITDVEPVEDDLSWVATLGAQVAPAVSAPEEVETESQASAPVSPAPVQTTKPKRTKTPKTIATPDRTDLAAQVGEAIKAAGSQGIRSDTLESNVCRSASQRVGDLRRQGWVIDSIPVQGSEVVRYVYQGMTAPRPTPTAGVRLYTYGDGSVESRSFVGVTDLDESAQLANHLALCAAAWIASRQVQP